ncbi:MAG TPA: aminotransferase class V-fold PLP-dependent enzyme [Stellaceae bacterium]|nr:aminotransferase class V-fold PLP-dependent enzyme [Stellaceae bacterium]
MPVYFDHNATSPLDPRVLEAMLPWFGERFGNPHSTGHSYGTAAAEAVEGARAQVAALIGAEPREIIFTSGATEANNLAIKGAARFLASRRDRVAALATEHKCVLESVRDLKAEGIAAEIVPVETSGLVDPDQVDAALNDKTALVSVMAAHNEIGVIQDLAAIGRIAKAKGVLLHTDAAQAFGKIPLDVTAMGIDLMSISGHKIYAPKGIGALYVRHKPRVRLQPLFSGGGQERGLRSGTVSPALAVALGAAAEICRVERETEQERVGALARRLREKLPAAQLNGAASPRLAGSLNLAFRGVRALDLMQALPDLAMSTGSACNSAEVEPSYVLRALGIDAERAGASLRISIGRFTTEAEIERAGERLAAAAAGLRANGLQPLRAAAT